MEQTVQADEKVPIWEHPDTSEQVEDSPHKVSAEHSTKSIEDLLAETGAPVLEPEQSPSLIVSHHKQHQAKWWHPILVFVTILLLAAIAINFLLDAEVIKTSLSLPHTDLIK
jgi:hypothetical protein